MDLENKGSARLLGECVLELGPLMSALNDIYGVGVRQHLSIGRRSGDKEVVVGRFTCILKLVVSCLPSHLFLFIRRGNSMCDNCLLIHLSG